MLSRETMLKLLLAILMSGVFGLGVSRAAREDTQIDYAKFPRLFHLDDYDRCLMMKHGVYCLGTFEISTSKRNPTYDLIQKYSTDGNNFNRTRLHRGYCLTQRCSPLQNATLRFSRCVSRWVRRHQLDVHLHELQYCHTREEAKRWKIEAPHLLFMAVVGGFILMNIVGTLYDAIGSGEKCKYLTCWSLPRSWRQLSAPCPGGDPRLESILLVDACRFVIILLVVFVHTGHLHGMMYLGNPELVERWSHSSSMSVLQNGSSFIQMLVLLSSFSVAQGVLKDPQPLSFWLVPKLMIKRILRIAPVYLSLLAFAATWWPLTRGGPLWTPIVEAESAACRRKFWPMAFFVGNFVGDDETCLIQTWYLQVDLQLHLLGLLLTVGLARARRWAVPVLAALFVSSCVASGVMAYVYRWTPLMLASGPENVKTLFSNVESFHAFYTKPWGSVSAGLAGLLVAHLVHDMDEKRFNARDHPWLTTACQLIAPLLPVWIISSGSLFRDVSTRTATAVLIAVEQPMCSVITALLLFGALSGGSRKCYERALNSEPTKNVRGFLEYVFSWRVWSSLERISLAVLMMHWCVNTIFAASRRGLYNTSMLDMVVDFVTTAYFTCILALPLALLVDLPMQQTFTALTSS